jgi:hypothetical protein
MVYPPRGNLKEVVFGWNGSAAALVLDSPALGHVYVETSQGERLLDAHPDASQVVAVHVPPERPLFVRRNDERAELVVRTREPVRATKLAMSTPEVTRRGALHLAFEKLFDVPFGAHNVAEFHVEREVAPAELGPSPVRQAVRRDSAILGVAAVTGGVVLNIVAFTRYGRSEGASQVAVDNANRGTQKLNLAAIICYAVGVAGGLVWGATYLWPETTISAGPAAGVGARGSGLTFAVERRF